MDSASGVLHFADLLGLADAKGLFEDPELAGSRVRAFRSTDGISAERRPPLTLWLRPGKSEAALLDALHHVAIIASDYDRSRRFYVDVLGLAVVAETYREARQSWKCDLRVGDAQIELFSFPSPPLRPSGPEAVGLRHLAFSVNDLDSVVTRLEASGVAVEPVRVDDLTTKRFTFFKDPDGLPLELYER